MMFRTAKAPLVILKYSVNLDIVLPLHGTKQLLQNNFVKCKWRIDEFYNFDMMAFKKWDKKQLYW